MLPGGVGLSDAEAKHELITQPGVRQIQVATLIQSVHQALVLVVAAAIAKAHQVQWNGSYHLETLVSRTHPANACAISTCWRT